jgi:hypothetical protein
MDVKEKIKAQIALAQTEQRQHEAAQQNAASGILQCMGAIRGLEMLLADLEKEEVAAGATPDTDVATGKDTP